CRGSLIDRTNGGNQDDNRNPENNDGDCERSFQTHGDCSFPIENPFETSFSLAGSRHRYPLPMHPSRRRLQRLKKAQECGGIVFLISSTQKSCFVAGLFCESFQLPMEPPRKWTEPEERAIQERNQLRQWIPPRNVGLLVNQDSAQLGLIPPAPVA